MYIHPNRLKTNQYVFTHYLITRFNIRVSGKGPEVLDSVGTNQEWFEERMRLFKLYCAPSVMEQTNTNFKWLIYFYPATPIDEIRYLLNGRVPVEFIFTEDFHSMLKDIEDKIRNASSHYVMTSRIDNDDAISGIFIQSIQNVYRPVDKTIINPNSGYIYEASNQLLTRWNKRYRNQFLSIIEHKHADILYTVYGFPHYKPPPEARIINIEGPPYWIYWRHSHNFSDQRRTGIPIFFKNKLKVYPIAVRTIPISWKNTASYAFLWFPEVLKRRLKNLFRVGSK
jgi:hypothetical protein